MFSMCRKMFAPGIEGSESGYGYVSDNVSPFNFGGNFGVTTLKEFKWIPNGGKNGAEQEALEIIFTINGTDKSYRKFPVVKAFKDRQEITDPNSPEVKEAKAELSQTIMHILGCFHDRDTVRAAFSRPIKNFKEFCQIAESILPKNYQEIKLDIFLQYGWSIPEGQSKTYLDIPGKMKYGAWICRAQEGDWREVKEPNPDENTKEALKYGDANTAIREEGKPVRYTKFHPLFVRNGWFMTSNFAKQQREAVTSDTNETSSSVETTSTDNNAGAAAW